MTSSILKLLVFRLLLRTLGALYTPSRTILEMACNEVCIRYKDYSEEQKFIFLMTNEHEKIIKALGKYIFESFALRDKMMNYFFT